MNKIKQNDWNLLPPPTDHCQECAIKHESRLPHNRDSFFYQTKFYIENDRAPTWHDAMLHCVDETKEIWIKLLKEKGVIL